MKSEEEIIAKGICQGLRELKMVKEGRLKAKSAMDFLNELEAEELK